MKKIISIMLVMALFFSTSIILNQTDISAETMKLSKTKVTLNVGDHFQLTVKGADEDASVKWSSSSKSTAAVSKEGVVVPKKSGKATIYAKIGKKTLKCSVSVRVAYTISKKSAVINVGNTRYATYSSSFLNSYTKDWYLFRSYLDKLEHIGGGTLVVKKGTYSITSPLCIPSNVNIILSKGVVINKTSKTHAVFPAGLTLFEFVPAAKYHTKNWAKKYSGVYDSKIIGKGKVVINMNYVKYGVAVTLCHNKNIEISGITFKNVNESHFIELDASKHVIVKNCRFIKQKGSNYNREAINLDIPDSSTGGFSKPWAKNDKTVNDDILISDCSFKKLYTAIGSHQYSLSSGKKQIYQKNITIQNCAITGTKKYGIHELNWKNAVVKGCKISNAKGYGIFGTGTIYPVVKDNEFSNCKKGALIVRHTTFGGRPTTYSKITDDFLENALKENTFKDCKIKVEAKE